MKKIISLLLAIAIVFSVAVFSTVTASTPVAAEGDSSAQPLYNTSGSQMTVAKIYRSKVEDAYYLATQYGVNDDGTYKGLFSGVTFNDGEDWKFVTLIISNQTQYGLRLAIGANWAQHIFLRSGTDGNYTNKNIDSTINEYQGAVKSIPSGGTVILDIKLPKTAIACNADNYSDEQAKNGSGTTPVNYGYFGLRFDVGYGNKFSTTDAIYVMSPTDDCVPQHIATHGAGIGGTSTVFTTASASEIPEGMREKYDYYKSGTSLTVSSGISSAVACFMTSLKDNSDTGAFRALSYAKSETSKKLTFYVHNNTGGTITSMCVSYGYAQVIYSTDTVYDADNKYSSGTKYDSSKSFLLKPGESTFVTLEVPKLCDAINNEKTTDSESKCDTSHTQLGIRVNFAASNLPTAGGTVDIFCTNDETVNNNLKHEAKTMLNVAGYTEYEYTEPETDVTTVNMTNANISFAHGMFADLEYGESTDTVTVSIAAYLDADTSRKITSFSLCYHYGKWLYEYDAENPLNIDSENERRQTIARNSIIGTLNKSLTDDEKLEEFSTDGYTTPVSLKYTDAIDSSLAIYNSQKHFFGGNMQIINLSVPKQCYVFNAVSHYVVYNSETGEYTDVTTKPTSGNYQEYSYVTNLDLVDYSDLGIRVNIDGSANIYTRLTLVAVDCYGSEDDEAALESLKTKLATAYNANDTDYISKRTYGSLDSLESITTAQFAEYVQTGVFHESFDENFSVTNDEYIWQIGSDNAKRTLFTNNDDSTVKAVSGENCLKFEAKDSHYSSLTASVANFIAGRTGTYFVQFSVYVETLPNGNCTYCTNAANKNLPADQQTTVPAEQNMVTNIRYINNAVTRAESTGTLKIWTKDAGKDGYQGTWKTLALEFQVTSTMLKENASAIVLGLCDYFGTNSTYYIDDFYFARYDDAVTGTTDILSAQVSVGSDLSLTCTALVPAWKNNVQAVFTRNCKTETITGEAVTAEEAAALNMSLDDIEPAQTLCKFVYTGINAQCMTDNVKVEIKCGDNVCATLDNYSVRQNCENLYEKNSTDTTLVKLMADLLEYGAKAQAVAGYRTSDLANSPSWVTANKTSTEFTVPTGVKTKLVKNSDENNQFSAVGLEISNTVKIHTKQTIADGNIIMISKNGGTLTQATVGDDGYVLTDAISADEFGTVFSFYIFSADTTEFTSENALAHINYSVNTYIAAKWGNLTTAKSDLLRTMSNFGQSVEAYMAVESN